MTYGLTGPCRQFWCIKLIVLIQYILFEHFFHIRPYSRHWGYRNDKDQGPYLDGTHIATEEIDDLFVCLFVCFRAASVAYGTSQARGQTKAAAASLHHSHSNVGSEPCL